MLDFTYVEMLGFLAAFAPIVILAALAVLDLRSLVLLRAVSQTKGATKTGEKRISDQEWFGAPLTERV